ncbi:MAG: hypothetical protein KDC95_21240 [Planctomycetes bacterium]|nr:hypothetical protein [Planctomycetota bacterium]
MGRRPWIRESEKKVLVFFAVLLGVPAAGFIAVFIRIWPLLEGLSHQNWEPWSEREMAAHFEVHEAELRQLANEHRHHADFVERRCREVGVRWWWNEDGVVSLGIRASGNLVQGFAFGPPASLQSYLNDKTSIDARPLHADVCTFVRFLH